MGQPAIFLCAGIGLVPVASEALDVEGPVFIIRVVSSIEVICHGRNLCLIILRIGMLKFGLVLTAFDDMVNQPAGEFLLERDVKVAVHHIQRIVEGIVILRVGDIRIVGRIVDAVV